MRPKTEQNEINNKQRQINQTSSQENRYRGPNKPKSNNQSKIKSKERITIKVRHKKKTFENHKGQKNYDFKLSHAWQVNLPSVADGTRHAWQVNLPRLAGWTNLLPATLYPWPATPKPLPARPKAFDLPHLNPWPSHPNRCQTVDLPYPNPWPATPEPLTCNTSATVDCQLENVYIDWKFKPEILKTNTRWIRSIHLNKDYPLQLVSTLVSAIVTGFDGMYVKVQESMVFSVFEKGSWRKKSSWTNMFTMQVRGARTASMVVEDPFHREGPFQGKVCAKYISNLKFSSAK